MFSKRLIWNNKLGTIYKREQTHFCAKYLVMIYKKLLSKNYNIGSTVKNRPTYVICYIYKGKNNLK